MSKAKNVLSVAVELVSVTDLLPYEGNARKHSKAQLEQIKGSIRQFGWTNPILRDGHELIAGHGRLQAAEELYAAGETIRLPSGVELPAGMVPTINCTGWTEAQRRAYVLADNRIAEGATWDEALLRVELVFLEEVGDLDIGLTGFTEADLSRLLAEPDQTGDQMSEWQGMPEFEQKDKKAFRSIALHFKDQQAVDAFAKLVGQTITPKTRFLWYPEIEIETYADKRYVTQE